MTGTRQLIVVLAVVAAIAVSALLLLGTMTRGTIIERPNYIGVPGNTEAP